MKRSRNPHPLSSALVLGANVDQRSSGPIRSERLVGSQALDRLTRLGEQVVDRPRTGSSRTGDRC